MPTPEEIDLFVRCQREWGVDSQLSMLTEECAELIQALSHLRRGRIGFRELASEVADVELLIGQLRYIFEHKDFDALIASEKAKKIKRILKRLGR